MVGSRLEEQNSPAPYRIRTHDLRIGEMAFQLLCYDHCCTNVGQNFAALNLAGAGGFEPKPSPVQLQPGLEANIFLLLMSSARWLLNTKGGTRENGFCRQVAAPSSGQSSHFYLLPSEIAADNGNRKKKSLTRKVRKLLEEPGQEIFLRMRQRGSFWF